MRKVRNVLFHRITVTVFLLLIQIGWLFSLILRFRAHAAWVGAGTSLISLIIMMFVISSKQNPAYKISWLVLVGIMPIFGTILYFLYSNKLPAKKLRQQIDANETILKQQLSSLLHKTVSVEEERLHGSLSYVGANGHYPPHQHTDVKYYPLGELMFADMIKDLAQAEKFIFFEYFIVGEGKMWQQMKAVMIEKARKGVDVRVMYDDFGSLMVLPKDFKKELSEAGIQVIPFNPLVPFLALGMNNRDHRKILIIDGNIGYNGGINIADEYINEINRYGHWKDTGVRLQGDAVLNLTSMFLSVWHAYDEREINLKAYSSEISAESKGIVQPFSDNPLDEEFRSETIYMDILWQAKEYVYIFTPYLVIDHEMYVALTSAAKRGVDVRLLIPKVSDQKLVADLAESYYRQLLEGGVRIYRYSPGFIHAKSYVSDDRIAVIGTINMDYRSLYLHFECGTFMIDTDAVSELKQDALDSFAVSEEVFLSDLRFRFFRRIYHSLLRIISPLV